MELDDKGRPVITEAQKNAITEALALIPEHRTIAALIIADTQTGEARLHLAGRVVDNKKWGDLKVAGGLGVPWRNDAVPSGWVGVLWTK